MRHEGHRMMKKDKHLHGDDHKRKDRHHHKHGAKTFRRGKALAFLDMLNVKRSTLQQQLQSPELQSINPIIVGELKAIEMVRDEFIQLFDLHEAEAPESDLDSAPERSSDTDEKIEEE